MKKSYWITTAIVGGLGVASYLVFKRPKWKVVGISRSLKDGLIYTVKVGDKKIDVKATKGLITTKEIEFPIFKFTFRTDPSQNVKGYPSVNMTVEPRFAKSMAKTIQLKKEGQKG